MTTNAVHVPLGHADYGDTLELQRQTRERRIRGEIPDTLLTVEHDPVFTFGRSSSPADLLASADAITKEGIALHHIERGGGITYHGPGQLVAYPIVDLRDHGRDVHRFVHLLEDALLTVVHALGVRADRRSGHPGLWLEGRKLASLGIHVRRWVTCHGIALNVQVNRHHFGMIRPCGEAIDVVSLADCIHPPPSTEEVESRLLASLADRFGWTIRRKDATWLTAGSE